MPKKYKKYQVTKGENLLMIAERELFGTNWQAIYFDKENEPFRARRKEAIRHFYPRLEEGEWIVIPERPRAQLVTGSKATLVRENYDFVARARELHSTYLSQYRTHDDWLTNPERVRELCIAEWTQTLLNQGNGSYDKRVDLPALQNFFDDYQKTSWLQVVAYSTTCRELVDLLKLKSFNSQLEKLEAQESANCYAELVSDLFLCRETWDFLRQEFEKFDKSDPQAIITKAFSIAEDANSLIWKLLAAFGPVIVEYKKSKALLYIEQLIIKRVPYLLVAQLETGLTLFQKGHGTAIVPTLDAIKVAVLTPEYIKLTDTPNIKRLQGDLTKAFTVINSALAFAEVLKNPDFKNSISAVGAILSVLAEFSIGLNKLMGRHLLTKAGELTFTMVAGIFDIIVSKMDAQERASYGDTNAAFAHVAAAGGASLLVLGEWMVFAEGLMAGGAATSPTGVGGLIAVAGLIILVAASIVAAICEDSQVESWLENSKFGKKSDSPASAYIEEAKDWKTNHAQQLKKLFDIIATVTCSAEFSTHGAKALPGEIMRSMNVRRLENDLRIYIKPSLMLTCSKVNLTVELTWGERARKLVALNNFPIMFSADSGTIIGRPLVVAGAGVLYNSKRIVEALVMDFHRPSELYLLELSKKKDSKKDIPYSTARVSLRVDLFGDGRVVYYRNADLKPEAWELFMRAYDAGAPFPEPRMGPPGQPFPR